MAINITGHAEIDQQHELLDSSVERLLSFCSEAKHNTNTTCDGCNSIKREHCRSVLFAITSELTVFLVGHSAYEEKMMELLPNTPICQEHVKAHKAAHGGISKQLKKLSSKITSDSPRNVSTLMWRVVGDWLNDHSKLFDTRLVRLGKFNLNNVDFDGELITMLDQYVFPNRPKRAKSSLKSDTALQQEKLEVRKRFESLSPAQHDVFWLVVSGKSNREIANALNVSINTIKTHRAAIFQKMDVKSVLELIKKVDTFS